MQIGVVSSGDERVTITVAMGWWPAARCTRSFPASRLNFFDGGVVQSRQRGLSED